MIKELYHSTTEKELSVIPIGSVLVDDWNASVELCKEKIVTGKSDKAYIYSVLAVMPRETGKRKLSAKYDCFYWKSIQEINPDEKYEMINSESEPKRLDL